METNVLGSQYRNLVQKYYSYFQHLHGVTSACCSRWLNYKTTLSGCVIQCNRGQLPPPPMGWAVTHKTLPITGRNSYNVIVVKRSVKADRAATVTVAVEVG